MLKRIAVIVFVLCIVSCPGSLIDASFLANNYKKIYKHSVCDPERPFPQMVVLPYFKKKDVRFIDKDSVKDFVTHLESKSSINATIIGLTQGNSVIWVWRGKDFKISKSSFAHELVHVSLRAINGHGDYDHEGSLREGWTEQHTELIIDVKRALDAFGL